MAPKTETRQMYCVVCEAYHTAFAPFRTPREAQRYADGLNEYSRRNIVDKGGDPRDACTYRVVPMWIQVIDENEDGVVEYDKNSASEKRKMN